MSVSNRKLKNKLIILKGINLPELDQAKSYSGGKKGSTDYPSCGVVVLNIKTLLILANLQGQHKRCPFLLVMQQFANIDLRLINLLTRQTVYQRANAMLKFITNIDIDHS